jgi:hypothetical protein
LGLPVKRVDPLWVRQDHLHDWTRRAGPLGSLRARHVIGRAGRSWRRDGSGQREEGRSEVSSSSRVWAPPSAWPSTPTTSSKDLLSSSPSHRRRMRSLTCLSSVSAGLPLGSSSQSATASAFDPESSVVYTVVESVSPDGEVQIDILAVKGHTESDVEPVSPYNLSSSSL